MSLGQIKPRILAIDYGTKRIGLAMSDPLHLFSQTLGTFDEENLLKKVSTIIDSDGVEKILIGLPTNFDGTENRMTEVVIKFSERLTNSFPSTQIEFVDEFGSSKQASGLLKSIGVTKKKRGKKGRLDKAVAAILLDEYLQKTC